MLQPAEESGGLTEDSPAAWPDGEGGEVAVSRAPLELEPTSHDT